jgi:ligand-binding SRPBCC domain-containing protein
MATIVIITEIHASIERCFDASRDLDLHLDSMKETGEKAVAGRTTGLIELGEQVTWEARHLGVKQRLTSKITAFDRPHYFQDSMLKGAFKSFVHDHYFESSGEITIMRDVITFRSPLGFLGAFVDRYFMSRYLHRLIQARNHAIKKTLESAAGLS